VAFIVTGRSLKRVDARLRMPEEAVAGSPFMVGLEASALPGAFPSPWARAVVTGPEGPFPGMDLPALPPGGRAVVCATARVASRGIHDGLGLSLQSTYPFSLFRRTRRIRPGGALVVTPRRHPIRALRVTTPDARGSVTAARPGDGMDLHNIRDYTPEDDARHIDWKASARMDRPMLREFERENERALDLVLDESPHRQARAGEFDAIVETAASILEHCRAGGIRARLIVAGGGSQPVSLEGREAMLHLAGAQPKPGPLPHLYGPARTGVPRIVLSLNPSLRTPFEIDWEEGGPGA